jgi:hypothetical protein
MSDVFILFLRQVEDCEIKSALRVRLVPSCLKDYRLENKTFSDRIFSTKKVSSFLSIHGSSGELLCLVRGCHFRDEYNQVTVSGLILSIVRLQKWWRQKFPDLEPPSLHTENTLMLIGIMRCVSREETNCSLVEYHQNCFVESKKIPSFIFDTGHYQWYSDTSFLDDDSSCFSHSTFVE